MSIKSYKCSASCFFFNSSELPIALTNFLNPYDLIKVSKVSKQFQKIANNQFNLLTKSNKKLNNENIFIFRPLYDPIVFFSKFPFAREKFVTFDESGKKYFKELLAQRLEGYRFLSEIPNYLTANQISDLINHLANQFSKLINNYHKTRSELFSTTILALEAGYRYEEVKDLNHFETHCLSTRKDLKVNDVKGLKKNQLVLLIERKDLKFTDIKDLRDDQLDLLMKRKDLKIEGIKELNVLSTKVLAKRKDLTTSFIKNLKHFQLQAMNVVNLSKREALQLSYNQAVDLIKLVKKNPAFQVIFVAQ